MNSFYEFVKRPANVFFRRLREIYETKAQPTRKLPSVVR